MLEQLPAWAGNLHDVLPKPLFGVVVTLVATACGAVVGLERGKREKPAGLRSMMLICLGATIFTLAGQLMSVPGSDPARISAQIVTGVGFLGAGAIIHGRGKVTGVTTAAAIWVVSAIGVIIGAGYVVPGVLFTLLAAGTLALESTMDVVVDGPCDWQTATVRFTDDAGKTNWLIQEVLDLYGVAGENVRTHETIDGVGVISIRYCRHHKHHRGVLPALARLSAVQQIDGSPL